MNRTKFVVGSLAGAVAIHLAFLACTDPVLLRDGGTGDGGVVDAITNIVDGEVRDAHAQDSGGTGISCTPDELFCDGTDRVMLCTHSGTDSVVQNRCSAGTHCGTAHCTGGATTCCARTTPMCSMNFEQGLDPTRAVAAEAFFIGEQTSGSSCYAVALLTCGGTRGTIQWNASKIPDSAAQCVVTRSISANLDIGRVAQDVDHPLAMAQSLGATFSMVGDDGASAVSYSSYSAGTEGTFRYSRTSAGWQLTINGRLGHPSGATRPAAPVRGTMLLAVP